MTMKIIRLPEVMEQTGLGRSTIYLRVSTGLFPSPVSLGGRAVGWLQSEIEEWINSKAIARTEVTR